MNASLIKLVNDLKRDEAVNNLVEARVREFQAKKNASEKELFSELSFCILTANYNAGKSISIQEKIGDGFLELGETELARELSEAGHRFPNTRARYIVEARKHLLALKALVAGSEGKSARAWLVENVKGLGWKEASHFLRNVGFTDVAIIDFHILDLLKRFLGAIGEMPKSLSKEKYFEVEMVLEELAGKTGLDLARLDLFLWHAETGKILK